MGWANHHRGHKTTLACPIKGCSYTSRKFVSISDDKNRLSNSSTKCPIHQTVLESIGGSTYAVTTLKNRK